MRVEPRNHFIPLTCALDALCSTWSKALANARLTESRWLLSRGANSTTKVTALEKPKKGARSEQHRDEGEQAGLDNEMPPTVQEPN